ncbi:MAG: hypothetical protein ABI560_11690 [Myxococcales bacterium]
METHSPPRCGARLNPWRWLTVVAVTAGALQMTGGCQSPRRDAIAREPIGPDSTVGEPFRFPYIDARAPADAPSRFVGGAGTTPGAPSIAYPLDGAMHAMNISEVRFQWTRGTSTNTLFRIRLDDGSNDYDFYTRCVAPRCLFLLPPAGWLAIASSHSDAQLTATVTGTDETGGPVYQSAAIAVRFSPAPVTGGLYYWTAATSNGGTTYRLPFGAATATPFIVPSSAINPLPCSGCHSVSRNGAMISFAAANDGSGTLGFLGTAPTQAPEQATIVPDATGGKRARFTALNADGSRVLTTTYGAIQVLDTSTGQVLNVGNPAALLPAGKRVTHPEWSPSGNRVALTLYTFAPTGGGSDISDARPEDGEIVTLEFDPVTGKATRLRHIVVPGSGDGGFQHFYPSWSPDEQWLVMAAAPRGTSAYAAPAARLRLVSAQLDNQVCPGPTCFELANASQGVNVSSTWPKFSPFSQSNGKVFFVTFSSRIDYGFMLSNHSATDGGIAQLWMSAIDLRALQMGQPVADPSLPPVWLPFQNVTQNNQLPFWSEVVACSADEGSANPGCGENQVCDRGECRVLSP